MTNEFKCGVIKDKDGKPVITHKVIDGRNVVVIEGLPEAIKRNTAKETTKIDLLLGHETVLDE